MKETARKIIIIKHEFTNSNILRDNIHGLTRPRWRCLVVTHAANTTELGSSPKEKKKKHLPPTVKHGGDN